VIRPGVLQEKFSDYDQDDNLLLCIFMGTYEFNLQSVV
jgi:hypothetical protein